MLSVKCINYFLELSNFMSFFRLFYGDTEITGILQELILRVLSEH